MNASVGRQGLWSVPGDGVLARQGDLILLSAIDERGLLDSLLDLLAETSEAGGDGRRLVDAVEDLIEGDETWGAGGDGKPGPAVVAFVQRGNLFRELVPAMDFDRPFARPRQHAAGWQPFDAGPER